MTATRIVLHVVGYTATAVVGAYIGKRYAEYKQEHESANHVKQMADKLDKEYEELVKRFSKLSDEVREKFNDRMDALKTKMAGSRSTLRQINDLRDEIIVIIRDLL